MQNLKYHILNLVSVIIFSYTCAITVNQVIKYNIAPSYTKLKAKPQKPQVVAAKKGLDTYSVFYESGFFKWVDPTIVAAGAKPEEKNIALETLQLMGTITGPSSIARALIQKKGEKAPQLFALHKVSNDVTNDVYGFKLIKIDDTRVFLLYKGEKSVLNLYEIKTLTGPPAAKLGGEPPPASDLPPAKQVISRSEMQQKVLNDMDTAMQGIVAGPYRINGKIEGFKLQTVRPTNIFYRLGARSGDVLKRVNGQAINSTERLYQIWGTIKNESKIVIDLERGGKMNTYELNMTD